MADQATLQHLIERGDDLRSEPYDSPRVKLWKNDVKATITPYGAEMLDILESAFWFGQVIMSPTHGQQMHNNSIDKVQVLLKELQDRSPEDSQAQSQLINQKKEEAKTTLSNKFGINTINGPVTFGNSSPANNIQVGELMLAIISQAEDSLSEGPEKSKIVEALKAITTNPAFASIAGASLPEILKKLFGN